MLHLLSCSNSMAELEMFVTKQVFGSIPIVSRPLLRCSDSSALVLYCSPISITHGLAQFLTWFAALHILRMLTSKFPPPICKFLQNLILRWDCDEISQRVRRFSSATDFISYLRLKFQPWATAHSSSPPLQLSRTPWGFDSFWKVRTFSYRPMVAIYLAVVYKIPRLLLCYFLDFFSSKYSNTSLLFLSSHYRFFYFSRKAKFFFLVPLLNCQFEAIRVVLPHSSAVIQHLLTPDWHRRVYFWLSSDGQGFSSNKGFLVHSHGPDLTGARLRLRGKSRRLV